MFWMVRRYLLARKKSTYMYFFFKKRTRFYENRCTVCNLKRRIRRSGSRPKTNLIKFRFPGPGLSSAGNPLRSPKSRKSTVQCGSVRSTKIRFEPIGTFSDLFVRTGYIKSFQENLGATKIPRGKRGGMFPRIAGT